MDKPNVSVIIPVYNGSNYIREAIDSVLKQTYKNYEVIIVDDGSTDDTWDIIQSYGNLIRAFHKENGGVSSALNLGIREMKGSWFAWLSHDDLWMPEKLETQVTFHNQYPNLMGSYTRSIEIDDTRNYLNPLNSHPLDNSLGIRALFMSNFIAGDTVFIHRKIFHKIGFFNEELRVTQDYDMWLRTVNMFDLGFIPEYLTCIRSHPNQDGKKYLHLEDGEFSQFIIKNFETFDKIRLFQDSFYSNKNELLSIAYYWFANDVCYRYRWPNIADEYYKKAFLLSPVTKHKIILHIKAKNWFRIRRVPQRAIRWIRNNCIGEMKNRKHDKKAAELVDANAMENTTL